MEVWKPLRDFPSYNGSSEGRIMNVRTQKILRTKINDNGYEQVCLRKNNRPYTVRVHKLIAETFLGPHPGMDVRHIDLDRTNNRVENLYWTSRSETITDAFERGSKTPPQNTAVRVIETDEVYESVAKCARTIGCSRTDIFKQLAGILPHVKNLHFERL